MHMQTSNLSVPQLLINRVIVGPVDCLFLVQNSIDADGEGRGPKLFNDTNACRRHSALSPNNIFNFEYLILHLAA